VSNLPSATPIGGRRQGASTRKPGNLPKLVALSRRRDELHEADKGQMVSVTDDIFETDFVGLAQPRGGKAQICSELS
jgi:hypothetical protein